MKLISFYTPAYEAIGAISEPRWVFYGKKHGMEFRCYKFPQLGSRCDFAWDKIELCRHFLDKTDDYLCWVDIDVLLLNPNFSIYHEFVLKATTRPLIIASDNNGICTGFFILKRCGWSFRYLDTMMFLGNLSPGIEKQINSVNAVEQSCAKYLLGFKQMETNVHILPDNGVISHPNRGIQPNTFAMHYWANNADVGETANKMREDAAKYPFVA